MWQVIDEEDPNFRTLFTGSEEACVKWIDNFSDKDKVIRGGFGIDGPEQEVK